MAYHGGFICELRHIFSDARPGLTSDDIARMPDFVTRLTEAS